MNDSPDPGTDAWIDRFNRLLLDFVDAPAEVELSTVEVLSSWNEAYSYSEYTGGDASLDVVVTWQELDEDSGEICRQLREISNEEVARFLSSLARPEDPR